MIIHPNFDPVAVSIGPLSVHWYGLMYLAGFAIGVWLGRHRARAQSSAGGGNGGDRGANANWQTGEITDLLFYIACGVIIGGRLGYVLFYNPAFYAGNLGAAFAIWDGGMSFHGGLLGVLAAVWWYARHTGRRFLAVGDFLAPLIAPGLGLGRLGNFINQELWGRASDAPWAVLFHTMPDAPRHPSQLYEFALEGVALFVIVWLYSARRRAVGRVSGMFLLGYGAARFGVEFFREPDAHLGTVAFDWLTMGQLLSAPMIGLGAYLLWRRVG
ncbi:MAG: prolipoprotein diacylglyceryl transferase [Gammaproteobacteria bacterium]|nr:prolipoprotein diacylglyceryl transferase [Gammaproteobacteria bacterium]